MKLPSAILATVVLSAALIGCDSHSHDDSTAAGPDGTHTHADGSTHAAHDDSGASHSHGHSHGGDIVALGEKQVLGFTITARREGAVAAGHEAVFLVETAPAAEAVRLWVGDEQATNAVRSRADGGPTSFHAHTMVCDSFTHESQLWVEVQNANGERGSVAFDLTAPVAGSHSHGSETHSHDDDSHSHGDNGHSH